MPEKLNPSSAAEFVPRIRTLPSLRKAATGCKGCVLWKHATQTVFGEGKPHQKVMLIGEQPGDQEDLQGRPFVGPAGRLLDRALREADIDRGNVYLTNTVKHFKFEPRGKRRIHKKPTMDEIRACRPWLEAEIDTLKPRVIVCLGATAAQALLGKDFRVSKSRGKFVHSALAPYVMATIHPSSLLRAPDDESRRAGMAEFVRDLITVRDAMNSKDSPAIPNQGRQSRTVDSERQTGKGRAA
jgi:uracil-DNA glycosylase